MSQGTSRFERASVALEEVDLQPPLDKIVTSGLARLRVSQYYFDEPLFDEYEATTVRATWDFPAAEQIVGDGDSVLDLGCGDGRLLLHLAERFELADSVGVDISEIAIDRFRAHIPPTAKDRLHARVGDIFDLPADLTERRFDVVAFGDATVNFVLEDERLVELLRTAHDRLRDESGRVLIAVFADGTPEQLAFMDGRTTVVPFRTSDGRASLIWWAYKFDTERLVLHRSTFVQSGWSQEGDIEGVVCDLRDRLWTPSSISPLAASVGLEVETVIGSEVQDGAAVGMGTAVMVLRRAR
ncbi:class I SAM-dependent methyltransferase [Streptomyces sp. SP18CS02]|uniref:class I SAM-dependent methyltransferase n=1 Tax=Streptomyces sp. SP18CS02 TaxID=3002531 RepID=UPI002E7775A2|nr:class I SAM-dependent methyltransferase [Streptomyces sp. SP18CS02]MEE1751536.1 class I SAM-dependent methyltransferase [Streptomyces sp. SP18CS02]